MPRARNQYIQEMKERFEVNIDRQMKSSAAPEETITLVDEQQNAVHDIDIMVSSRRFILLFIFRNIFSRINFYSFPKERAFIIAILLRLMFELFSLIFHFSGRSARCKSLAEEEYFRAENILSGEKGLHRGGEWQPFLARQGGYPEEGILAWQGLFLIVAKAASYCMHCNVSSIFSLYQKHVFENTLFYMDGVISIVAL